MVAGRRINAVHPPSRMISGMTGWLEAEADSSRQGDLLAGFFPNLHATLLSRTFPEGTGKIRLLMIHVVHNGRIARAWSMERLKKYCSPAERGFLGLGEALAKAQVSENPETSG